MPKLLPFLLYLFVALILVSILMPAGGFGHLRPRESARKATCMSNLKQLSGALLMYAEDTDGRLPPSGVWCDVVGTRLLKPEDPTQARRSRVFKCPSDVAQNAADSYAMNRVLSGAAILTDAPAAGVVLLFESDLHRSNAAGSAKDLADPERHPSSSSGSGGCAPATRGNSFAFLDGHVNWIDAAPPFETPESSPSPQKAAPNP